MGTVVVGDDPSPVHALLAGVESKRDARQTVLFAALRSLGKPRGPHHPARLTAVKKCTAHSTQASPRSSWWPCLSQKERKNPAHFPASHPWQVDPYCQELTVCEGRSFHRWPFNRTYTEGILKVGDPLPGSIWGEVLLAMIPQWPLTVYTLPVDPATTRRIVPIDALRSEEYRLLSSSESVAGEECAIFDNGGEDRMWVATNKGLCVMRHEIPDPHSGSLLQLAPQQLPGMLQYDRTNGFRQVVAGGEDLLDAMVDFMVEYGGLPTERVLKRHSYVWFGLGVVSGLCGGFVVFSIIGKQLAKAKIR